jgi:cell division protein FtsB
MAFYTVIIVGGIHSYEDKLKRINQKYQELETTQAKEALPVFHLAKEQGAQMRELDQQNKVLKTQIQNLKSENSALRNGIHTKFPDATI